MRRCAVDTETHLIKPGMTAPKMVCLSWAEGDRVGLLDDRSGVAFARALLLDPTVVVVGHNAPFDLAVLCAEDPSLVPLVFAAYDAGRITDTMCRQKLIDIANGELDFRRVNGHAEKSTFTLAALAKHWLGRILAKGEDTYRLRYAELQHVPIEDWPPAASSYAMTDATTTLDVDTAQLAWCAEAFETGAGKKDGVLPNEAEQMRAQWALHLIGLWGVRTDGDAVAKLRALLEAEQATALATLQPSGIFRPDGTRDMGVIRARVSKAYKRVHVARGIKDAKPEAWAAMVEAREGDEGEALTLLTPLFEADPEVLALVPDNVVPQTPGGQVATDAETLKESGDPLLLTLAQSGAGAKILSTYVPILERGTKVPITSRPNVLVASGRTSWSDPNLQNPPQKGGVRECFIPRPGYVYVAVDYDTIELRALAQVCIDLFSWSKMADRLNAGEDLHTALGARFLGVDYARALEMKLAGDADFIQARKNAKGFNFGRPGGMGADRMVDYLKASGTILHPDRDQAVLIAKRYIKYHAEEFPEIDLLFNHVANLIGDGGRGTLVQLRSGRIRGDVGFCDGANSYFQGLAADGAKAAVWATSRECYDERFRPGKRSPLFGCRPVLFLHDEIIIEAPEARVHEAGARLATVMIEEMRKYVPDVLISAKPVAFRRWWKGAEPVLVDGKLVPSKPKKIPNKKDPSKTDVVWEADL